MRQKMKQLIGILLSISLMLGLMPGMSLTAYADGTTYNPASTYTGFSGLIGNDTEVIISEVSGKTWYVIANDSSTVTLLSKQSFANKAFNSSGIGNDYTTSEIKTYVDELTGEGQPLEKISSVISDLALIDITTAQGLSETKRKGDGTDWWLCSQGGSADCAAFVDGDNGSVDDVGFFLHITLGVRPALKLNLSSVIFESESKTFSLTYADYDVTTPANREKSGDDLKALQVKFNEKSWYIIADNSTAVDAGTVTLLAAESFGTSKFHDYSNAYSTSTIRTTLYNMTDSGGSFARVASAINTVKVKGSDSDDEVDAKLYLLNTTEANNMPENVRKFSDDWWLCSRGGNVYNAAFVFGDNGGVNDYGLDVDDTLCVRPALKLNLSSVIFESESKTFSLKPYADYDVTTEANKTKSGDALTALQVSFNGIPWYIIADNSTAVDAGTVTLLAAESFGTSKFHDYSNAYSTSTIRTTLYNMTASGGSFARVASAINTVKVKGSDSDDEVDAKLYLLNTTEANNVPKNVRRISANWWLCTQGRYDYRAAIVSGADGDVFDGGYYVDKALGVRPALKLNLSSVIFSSVNLSGGANAAASGGNISQNYFDVGSTRNAMTTVTYTANTGYHFPENSTYYTTTSGIIVARTDAATVTVYGTPNANVSITVPDAVPKTYTVTLDNQGATTTGAASVTATYNAVLPSIADNLPAKTDYTFGGYFSETNGGTQYLNADGTPTDAVWTTDGMSTLYAKWTANPKEDKPTATFTAADAAAGKISDLTANAAYTISGAGLSNREITADAEGKYSITSGMTSGKLYIVKKGNGTTTVDSDAQEISVTKANAPDDPSASDCTTRANNDGKITGVTAEMEYRKSDAAGWTAGTGDDITGLTPGTYYVRTKAHDAVLASGNQTLTIGVFDAAAVTISTVNKEVTWSANGITIPVEGMFTIPSYAGTPSYSVANGTGEGSYADGKLTVTKCGTFTVTVNTAETATHDAGNASATLTVNAVSETYNITFDANGGSVSPASGTTGTDGKLASLPDPEWEGHSFIGWFTKASGGTEVTTSTVFSSNDTVYAHWDETPSPAKYTITFDPNGGTVSPESGTTGTDGKLSSLPTPIWEGHTFVGWFTKKDGGSQVTGSTVFSSNDTVYAHWENDRPSPGPEPDPPGPTPEPNPTPVAPEAYKAASLGGLTIGGASLDIRLYGPRNTVSYNGRIHVAKTADVAGKRNKVTDLDISIEGAPGFVVADYVYGKTKDASEGKAWFAAKLSLDKSSASFNALSAADRKKLESEIKKANKALKKKANRVYFSIRPLDLGEFKTEGTGSGNGKVFVRKDGSGDKLVLKTETSHYIDPVTHTVKGKGKPVLHATLSGYEFKVPRKEYKKTGPGQVAGKGKNFVGTVGN